MNGISEDLAELRTVPIPSRKVVISGGDAIISLFRGGPIKETTVSTL
jgi:hypothetical protein